MIGNRFNIREHVRLDFRKCFVPTEPVNLQTSAPPLDDEDIKSGQLVVLDSGLHKEKPVVSGWRVAQSADSGKELYLALADAEDMDTQASGILPCWPLREPAEIDTGYILLGEGESLEAGDLLTIGDGGYLIPYDSEGSGNPVAQIGEAGPLGNGGFVSSAVHVESAAFFRLLSAPKVKPAVDEGGSQYFRPGGVDQYLQPDGSSVYLRP